MTRGAIDLTLPAAGPFQVWFEGDGFAMLGNEQEVTLSAGANERDFDLQGATLKVTLNQWARRAPVDISVTPVVMSRPGKVGDNRQVHPTDPLPYRVQRSQLREDAVQARECPAPGQGAGRVGGATVALDDAQPETEVELMLTDISGIVRVLDQTGAPIADATVKAGQDRLLQTSPGVFSLANVAPATSVLASAPGFTPVLRVVSNESPFDIVLTRGRQVRLQFAGGNPPIAKGSFVWPATDAPVPLHLFAVTRSADGTGDFIVHDFPAVPGVILYRGPIRSAGGIPTRHAGRQWSGPGQMIRKPVDRPRCAAGDFRDFPIRVTGRGQSASCHWFNTNATSLAPAPAITYCRPSSSYVIRPLVTLLPMRAFQSGSPVVAL